MQLLRFPETKRLQPYLDTCFILGIEDSIILLCVTKIGRIYSLHCSHVLKSVNYRSVVRQRIKQ
jgi:hypothetical protein